jgi:ubiquinone biosynthesis protein
MNEQVGWRGLLARLEKEAPHYAQLLPELPRLLHQRLLGPGGRHADDVPLRALLAEQRRTNRLLQALVFGALGFLAGVVVAQILLHWRG